jgi:hypothetical protein
MEGNELDIGVGRGDMRLPYSIVEELKIAQNQFRGVERE